MHEALFALSKHGEKSRTRHLRLLRRWYHNSGHLYRHSVSTQRKANHRRERLMCKPWAKPIRKLSSKDLTNPHLLPAAVPVQARLREFSCQSRLCNPEEIPADPGQRSGQSLIAKYIFSVTLEGLRNPIEAGLQPQWPPGKGCDLKGYPHIPEA